MLKIITLTSLLALSGLIYFDEVSKNHKQEKLLNKNTLSGLVYSNEVSKNRELTNGLAPPINYFQGGCPEPPCTDKKIL